MKRQRLGRAAFLAAIIVLLGPHTRACLAQNLQLNPAYGTVTLRGGMNAKDTVVRVDAGGRIQTNRGGIAAWVANPPDVRLNFTAGNAKLILRVESDADTTLLVNLPDGSWIANDDGPNTGLNPYLRFDKPASGQYDIWVGTYNQGGFPPALLYISEISNEMARMAEQFAVVELENRTGKHPIRYTYRWGEGAWEDGVLLNPGRHKTHSVAYDKNGGRAPVLQVRFEKGIGVEGGAQVYNLDAYASKSRGDGKGYNFTVRTGDNTRDTIDLFKRTKNEEDASFKLSTSMLRILAGSYKEGEDLAARALQLDPTSARAYLMRGRARQFGGNYDGALRDYAAGLRLAPTEVELVVYRAETFGSKKRYDRVIDEVAKALELDPFHAGALTERAAANYAMRNYDLAIADCRKAIKLDAKNWPALTTLGEAWIAKGQPIMALDSLNQAIAIEQKVYEPYAARAQVYYALGEPGKASLDLQQATRLRMPPGYQVFYPDDEALRALDSYQIGALVAPDMLKKFNMQNFEVDPPTAGKGTPKVALDLEELVAGEWGRHRAFKFDAVAGVNRFLAAARMTENQRKANGMQLDWYYGPVTSPVARFRSGDDLGGLRVIGNLKLPDRKELTMIFALSYYPPTGEKVENGKVGMLFDGDNCRIQVRMHSLGSLETDYLFQSFGANLQQGQMVMRPGYNLDETTGALTYDALTSSSLSTRCMHCHNKGFEPSERMLDQLKVQRANDVAEIAKFESLKKFLELANVNGAGRIELKQLEQQMIKGGPNSLLPLDDLYRANRQYWLEVFPQYVEMRRDPRRYLEPPARKDGPGPPRKNVDMKMTK